jgi:hypothetical protein
MTQEVTTMATANDTRFSDLKARPRPPTKRETARKARAEQIGRQIGVPLALARTGAGYVLVSATMAASQTDVLLERLEIACEESHELAFGKQL